MNSSRCRVLSFLLLAAAIFLPRTSAAGNFQLGDVVAGVSNGTYNIYDSNGVFLESISDGLGGFTTGCAANPDQTRLYTTNFSNTKVVVYDVNHPHNIVQTIDTNAQNPGGHSESVVFDAAGNFYVGHPDGTADILKYTSAGVFSQAFNVAIEDRGSDWLDLAVDQKTMFYTSEGFKVFRYDVSTSTQLADFAVLPDRPAFALRLLPPFDGTGGLIVANTVNVKRLDGSGAVVQTYDVAGEDGWFSMNLDPDGTSFWAGSFDADNFYKFDIATGNVLVGPINAGPGFTLFGLCVVGEITAAIPRNITLAPAADTNFVNTNHTVTATVLENNVPLPGATVTFQVVSGPNTGASGTCSANANCTTDANGQVSFTYLGSGGVGTDVITATFVDADQREHVARATKEWVTPPFIEVHLDIHPTSCPNPLNVKKQGVIPAAILGTAGFDPAGIDVSTIRLVGVAPLRSSLEDVAAPFTGQLCGCTREGPDGFVDLTLKFDAQQVLAALGPVTNRQDVVLNLTGNMRDGTEIRGADCMSIRSGGRGQMDAGGAASLKEVQKRGIDWGNRARSVEYGVAETGPVSLAVFDVAGRMVKQLVRSVEPAGTHTIEWDASGLPGGIYFYRLRTGDTVLTEKTILIH